MPTLKIDLDPTVLASLASAGSNGVINISVSLGERPAEPAPAAPRVTGPLADLMNSGLLRAGEELSFHQRRANRTGRAVVTEDGQLIVKGHPKPFTSPSKAAAAVTGNVINGWTLWRTSNGRGPTLDELRERLPQKD